MLRVSSEVKRVRPHFYSDIVTHLCIIHVVVTLHFFVYTCTFVEHLSQEIKRISAYTGMKMKTNYKIQYCDINVCFKKLQIGH